MRNELAHTDALNVWFIDDKYSYELLRNRVKRKGKVEEECLILPK